jgi:hypothetical protein
VRIPNVEFVPDIETFSTLGFRATEWAAKVLRNTHAAIALAQPPATRHDATVAQSQRLLPLGAPATWSGCGRAE